jgi:hypothetical protein
MPTEYGSILSPNELDDLISYLMSVAKVSKPEPQPKPNEEEEQ